MEQKKRPVILVIDMDEGYVNDLYKNEDLLRLYQDMKEKIYNRQI